MIDLVVVNGVPRVGKDTFVDHVIIEMEAMGIKGYKYSTATTVKSLAKAMGWDGEKSDASRVMLSQLKDLYTEHFDGTLIEMFKLLTSKGRGRVLFCMIREPEEIVKVQKMCALFPASFRCTTLLIRPGKLCDVSNLAHSDKRVEEFEYDQILTNPKEAIEDWKLVSDAWLDMFMRDNIL